MDAKRLVLTRLLPKTGQVTSYRTGDDGTYEAGWWRGRLNADNKTRFIHIGTGSNTLTIDLATGLMWPADGSGLGCFMGSICSWDTAVIYANALDLGGFTDWRLPNIKELMSIVDYNTANIAIDLSKFPATTTGYYWSATTNKGLTTLAWTILFSTGSVSVIPKSGSRYLRCVRGGL